MLLRHIEANQVGLYKTCKVGYASDLNPVLTTQSKSMTEPGKKGIARIINAAGYSFQGLTAAFRNEAAFRQELALVVLLTLIAFWLDISRIETAILIASLLLVIIVELLNSAIEAIVDRVGSEHHELSGRAKDIGSAAVLISLINVVVVWTIILI